MGHPVSAGLEGYCLSLVLIDSCMAFLDFFFHYEKEKKILNQEILEKIL